MRVGTTAAAIENNLQELIAARLETEIEMERIHDRQTGRLADRQTVECMWKSVATAHENRSWMGHATNVESFFGSPWNGASSATPPLPPLGFASRFSRIFQLLLALRRRFSVFGSQRARKFACPNKQQRRQFVRVLLSCTAQHALYSNLCNLWRPTFQATPAAAVRFTRWMASPRKAKVCASSGCAKTPRWARRSSGCRPIRAPRPR